MSDQQNKDLRKLCIKNLNEAEVDRVLNMCREFAEVISHNVHNNRAGNQNMCMLFPFFNSKHDAEKAKEGLTAEGLTVDYANTKRPEPRSPPDTSVGNISADSNRSDPYGICIRCGQNAYYNCARCDDFYCSVDCQKIDWPVHKLHCFPMPELLPSRTRQTSTNGKAPKRPVTEAAPQQSSNDRSVEAPAAISNGTELVAPETSHGVSSRQKMHSSSNGGDNTVSQPSTSTSTSTPTATATRAAAIKLPPAKSIPNDSEVFITFVRSHQAVYIRSVATSDAFIALAVDVAEAALTASNLEAFPCLKEDMVLAPYDGIYYRGLVLSCDTDSRLVRIAFIDFGNTEEVPFHQLKVLPDELSQRPRLTLMVKLKNVKDNPEEEEVKAMKLYLEKLSEWNDSVKVKVHGAGADIEKNDAVELLDLDTNQSITEKLNRLLD